MSDTKKQAKTTVRTPLFYTGIKLSILCLITAMVCNKNIAYAQDAEREVYVDIRNILDNPSPDFWKMQAAFSRMESYLSFPCNVVQFGFELQILRTVDLASLSREEYRFFQQTLRHLLFYLESMNLPTPPYEDVPSESIALPVCEDGKLNEMSALVAQFLQQMVDK